MSKSILVIDTPERCSMCKLLERTEEGYCYCRGLGFDYQVNEYIRSTPKGKPDWCPLEEIKDSDREELRQYRATGTVEECREARERQRGKKIIHNLYRGIDEDWLCPSCGKFCNPYHKFCTNCGQKVECDNE